MLRQNDSDLIGRIYTTAESSDQWRPLLDDLCSRLGVRSAVAQLLHDGRDRLEVTWNARDSLSTEHAALHDAWAQSSANPRLTTGINGDAVPSEVGSDHRLYSHDRPAMDRLNAGLSRIGLGPGFWAGFELAPGRHFSIIMHRASGVDQDLNREEESLLRQLLPHLKRAISLGSRIGAAQQQSANFQAALNRIEVATLLCDADLRVAWSNDAALQSLAATDAIAIVDGCVRAGSRAGADLLARLLADASEQPERPAIVALPSRTGEALHLRARRTGGGELGGGRPQFIFYLSLPDQEGAADAEEIAALYGLTGAEARLAAAMLAGCSLGAYADSRGIAVATVRTQLKQVLAKTGTGRQAEFIRVLGRSVLARTH